MQRVRARGLVYITGSEALGAAQTHLARLSKRPWIDFGQLVLTFSRYKGQPSTHFVGTPARIERSSMIVIVLRTIRARTSLAPTMLFQLSFAP